MATTKYKKECEICFMPLDECECGNDIEDSNEEDSNEEESNEEEFEFEDDLDEEVW